MSSQIPSSASPSSSRQLTRENTLARTHQTNASTAPTSSSRGLTHAQLFGSSAALPPMIPTASASSHHTQPSAVTQASRQQEHSANSLLALRSRRNVEQLKREIQKLTYADNFGNNLTQAADLIHNDLRTAFHRLPLSLEDSEHIESLCRRLNETLEGWAAEVSELDNAVLRADPANLPTADSVPLEERLATVQAWKDVTLAWKKFTLTIPTEEAARQQRIVAQRMRNLFRDEVQQPLAQATSGQRMLSAAEAQAQNWVADAATLLANVFSSADALLDSTIELWQQFDLRVGVPVPGEGDEAPPAVAPATTKPWDRFRAKTKGKLSRMMAGLKVKGGRRDGPSGKGKNPATVGVPTLVSTTMTRGDLIDLRQPFLEAAGAAVPAPNPEIEHAPNPLTAVPSPPDPHPYPHLPEPSRATALADAIHFDLGGDDNDDYHYDTEARNYLAERARHRAAALETLDLPREVSATIEERWLAHLQVVEEAEAEAQAQAQAFAEAEAEAAFGLGRGGESSSAQGGVGTALHPNLEGFRFGFSGSE
ncbi:uncharacterized protein K452DRAFT_307417 [Aplosporella prunicola CBS 121167]|uniref:Uncharacterized protein n=1 Tax=Aplosporella prunicola CBS 121167 TaxID=1176127 RepID=A0A6A6BH04_9PEZI|nr:uncharacterized protein K452DRAFT_307417 [Aplosporella prunicola CBS 121167]KAF2143256.1 hypothetical protein K452DRAFT_307417 [Aplosporella prunicola CBS 121167]